MYLIDQANHGEKKITTHWKKYRKCVYVKTVKWKNKSWIFSQTWKFNILIFFCPLFFNCGKLTVPEIFKRKFVTFKGFRIVLNIFFLFVAEIKWYFTNFFYWRPPDSFFSVSINCRLIKCCCCCYRHLFHSFSWHRHSRDNNRSVEYWYISPKQFNILDRISLYIHYACSHAIMLMINWNDLQSSANNDYSFHFISCHYISSHCVAKCLKWQIKVYNAKWGKLCMFL